MPRKLTTAQAPFKLRVANLAFGSDPSRGPIGNPVKVRSTFKTQFLPEIPGRGESFGDATQADATPGLRTLQWTLLENPTTGTPVLATGTLTVADNNFSEPAYIYLGNYTLMSGSQFAVGGGAAATATNIAAAINACPGFSALAAGTLVTITGPAGPAGNTILFAATYEGTIQNFTLVPTDGSLTGAEPILGPVEIG